MHFLLTFIYLVCWGMGCSHEWKSGDRQLVAVSSLLPLWVQGFEHRSSAFVASPLTLWVILLASHIHFQM